MMENHVIMPNDIMLGAVTDMLKEGHSVIIKAKGFSMNPFIRGGEDSIEMVRCASYEPMDIVLAELRKGQYVAHRIIAMDGNKVTLKGDGNLRGVEHCLVCDISGKVVNIIKPDGRKVDCLAEQFQRRSRMWRSAPYIVRRIILAIYRRLK